MSNAISISKKDIWKAIWLDNNKASGVAADFLRELLTLPQTSLTSTAGVTKIAIVIGHNETASGAYAPSPINMSEFELNSLVGERMVEIADSDPNYEIKVFFRKPLKSYRAQILDVYRRVNDWNPDSCLELHFNWLGGAGRIEMIYSGSTEGERLATCLLDATSQSVSGLTKLVVRSSSDRGGLSIHSCKAPCVLTEPFDCSNEQHLAEVKRLGVEGLAQLNYEALVKYHETI